ncbi:MAG: bacteriophage holin [Patescibacteria group bacterium]|nr:bacteriophage holin [Patescibacteria group bacterium]MDE2438350.1 bacteriophage holin [Patescibacteria group bacterium]
MNTCSPKALGVALGVLWALYVFFAGIFAMYGWGSALVALLSSFYLGYGASFAGALIGAVWAFVDGFVAGAIIAWVYNKIA